MISSSLRLGPLLFCGAFCLSITAGAQDMPNQVASDTPVGIQDASQKKGEPALPEPQLPNEPSRPEADWPKLFTLGDFTYSVSKPQFDSWDRQRLKAWSAVEVTEAQAENKVPVFGVIALEADTEVNEADGEVYLTGIVAKTIDFPTDPQQEATMVNALRGAMPTAPETLALDDLEQALQVAEAKRQGAKFPLKNTPPRIVFAQTPTMLLLLSGEPVLKSLPGLPLDRVANTRALMLVDKDGQFYLHFYDGWLTAPAYAGPWSVVENPPADLAKAKAIAVEEQAVDLLAGQPDPETEKLPSLENEAPPAILVATRPTELIVSEEQPEWVTLGTTGLEYVENTPANWFRTTESGEQFLLLSGRWFKNSDPSKNEWQFVPGQELPEAFVQIPDQSPKENVKASVPNTPQADEAFIANTIPRTEVVQLSSQLEPPPNFGSERLELKPIEGTDLFYVANSQTPIIKVADDEWYAVDEGAWFFATNPDGPWQVAQSVPAEIYSIPPSSPVYYVTYVQLGGGDEESVTTEVYPGYYGAIPTSGGTVVYGTGYDYVDYVSPATYVAYPVTYGYLSNVYWTPWAGWYCGFGVRVAWGPRWNYWRFAPPAPYWGGYYRYSYGSGYRRGPGRVYGWGTYRRGGVVTRSRVGPRGAVVGSGVRTYNPYTGNRGRAQYQYSYNSRTGTSTARYKAGAQNVFTGTYSKAKTQSRVNPIRGTTSTRTRTTVGNRYTGDRATVAAGTRTNVRTGNVTNYAAAGDRRSTVGAVNRTNAYTGQTKSAQFRSNNRGTTVARSDTGQVYAGRNGNVYRRTNDGWNRVNRSTPASRALSNRSNRSFNAARGGASRGGAARGGRRR